MINQRLKAFLNGIMSSYSQVFFSDNRLFAIILILVSLIDYNAGLTGLVAVITSNIIALSFGFYKTEIEKGLYGFNSLLVGLGLGSYFAPSFELFIFIIISAFISVLLLNFFKGVFLKYQLPYLSLPFIFSLWIIMLASRYFPNLGISERGIFTFNTLYNIGGTGLVDIYERLSSIPFSMPVRTYFISLAAIFFQYSIFSGILISIGILIFSRIAFLLSIVGYASAYYFYSLLGGNIAELSYSYIGFNFILTSIAVGGFFLIPSFRSFLWAVFLTPIVILLTVSLSQLFAVFHLSVYSLPFNLAVILFLYTLKFRTKLSEKLTEVQFQFNNPEKNLYYFNNHKIISQQSVYIPFRPPFHGIWTVSQAHDGDISHKDGWRHAWDFVITDKEGKEFTDSGLFPENYYCYGKSILSPADGIVDQVIDHIPDNEIGKYNLEQNWGNTIIIKHSENLYSSLNHLKPGSAQVKPGEAIKKGQKVAELGNSGRSPYPHLHLQFQTTPYIGSKTIFYPLGFYMLNNQSEPLPQNFHSPLKNDKISAVEISPSLKNAFNLIPGKIFKVTATFNNKKIDETWEVLTDIYNNSYIYNSHNGAAAWFIKNEYQLYFSHFTGDKNSVLYYFYLSFYKVFLAYYKNLLIEESIPQNIAFKGPILYGQDFFAPFFLFLNSDFKLRYNAVNDEPYPNTIKLVSSLTRTIFGKKISGQEAEIIISNNTINSFKVYGKSLELYAEIN
jgi:urea transporter/murein DD-endopeptidase MepM/ murein hydrolase activator NlpD